MASRSAIALLVIILGCDRADKPDVATVDASAAGVDGKSSPSERPASSADKGKPPAATADPDTAADSGGQGEATGELGPPPTESLLPPPDPIPTADSKLLVIEARTPAARGSSIAQNVGAETLPGRISPTLTIGCELPCWQPMPVWPPAGKTAVEFSLFRGKDLTTKGATALGKYRVDSVPIDGTHSEVVIGLGVVDGSLQAHARLLASGDALPLTKVE